MMFIMMNKSVAATFKVCITKYQDLEKGLVRVSDDRLLSYMFDVEETFSWLNLYLDHLDMNLSEYLSQAITYDMDACVSKIIGPPKKSTSNIDKGIDSTEGDEARTSTINKGKEKVSQDATEVVETRRSTVEIDTESEYDNDDDSDYQSDKSVDYLSPGEEELIELRNKMKANRVAKAKAKDNPVSKINEPNDENSMPANNVRGETFEEHDIYMNKLLRSLKTDNKNGIAEYPFISIEKHVERYPMYDETTHWRLRKPKVGEKYVSVTQFKECLTYYALANGFSLWYEMSVEVRVVAKCGQRPARLSDPKKSKQRKQTKYPSTSSDDLPTFALTKEPKDHRKSKHIDRKYHFVRSKVVEGHVIVKDVRSEDNLVDPFTKALAKSKHDKQAWSIGLKDKIKF
ncbi:hypothetical protein Tco_1563905 [Tanacetum coccineum]